MISFCFFSLIILVYYIRRRYHLYLEMKTITAEQLWFLSFQNHLKNLRIKAMIANFVMIILLVEIGTRVCFIIIDRCFLIKVLKLYLPCSSGGALHYIDFTLEVISQESYFPLLCLFVKVLWLVYLRSSYRYSVMKWVGYVVMKITAFYVNLYIGPIISHMVYSDSIETNVVFGVSYLEQSCCILFEYIYYLIYSRRFYLLLKGIELENKLSLDRKKYLESKFLRVHFKVCTILVAVAFFFRVIAGFIQLQPFIVKGFFRVFPSKSLSPKLKNILEDELSDKFPVTIISVSQQLKLSLHVHCYIITVL